MSDTPRTDALFGDWLLGMISANQLLRSVCQIEKELTETKKQIVEGAEHLEETKKLLADSVSEQHKLQDIAFKLDSKAKKLQEKTKSAGYRIALLKEAIMHSNCALKTVKDIAGLPASVMSFIDCARGVNDGVLAWKNSLEKPSIIAQDTEQPPKNQEGTTE